jgi:hypothetical protein
MKRNPVDLALFCTVAAGAMILCSCGGGGGGGSATTDTTAPTLAAAPAINPANGVMGAAYASTVNFTASEALSTASINMTCDGIDVPGATTVSGAVATYTPTAPGYAANAKCVATMNASGTKDVVGNAFASNVTITNFTVKALSCTGTATNGPPSLNGTALVAACGNIFIDPTVAKNQYPVIVDAVSASIQSDKVVYDSLVSTQPDVIVCSTTTCGTYFAGASLRNVTLPPNNHAGQYTVPRTTIVLTSATYKRNTYVLAHEFSHVEVAARLNGAHVPAWFDEGLATYVGAEPVCTNVTGKGIPNLLTLDLESDWVTYTNNSNVFLTTYCQARAEVAAWVAKRGNAAIGQLLQAVSQGQNFSSQYGAMQTQ